MKFSDVRWLLRATYANCLLTLLVIFTRSSESSQFKKKINGIDCTDDASVCESNGKCLTLDQERWSTLNASQKSICRCTHNWHGDYCSVCMGRFSLESEIGIIMDGKGNYSSNTNCTWLLNPKQHDKLLVKVRIDEFSTECGWDHLYIHDGSSFDSPLVAVLSGFIPDSKTYVWSLLTLKSGSGYFYFTSDSEFNMPGFHIEYSYVDCPNDCSGNGFCGDNGTCICNEEWNGPSCSFRSCPKNCSFPDGICKARACSCLPGFRGDDCGRSERSGYWEMLLRLSLTSRSPPKVASHKSLVVGDHLYVLGGYSFMPRDRLKIYRFEFDSYNWTEVLTENRLAPRYGHAVDTYNGSMYLCGGTLEDGEVSDELWVSNAPYERWRSVPSADGSKMVGVSGHSIHVVDGTLFVFFGHSPTLGYINFIQRFNLVERVWSLVRTSGAVVTGLYGHTSVFDEDRSQILVHGGFSSRSNLCSLKDDVVSFDLRTFSWKYLKNSGHVKYLHSAVILDGLMFVFGGNTHNDTAISHGARCFSSKFLVYDIECNYWFSIDEPNFQYNAARYGHTANVHKGGIYFFGGFNGVLYNDLFKFTPGTCNASSEVECLKLRAGTKCAFVDDSKCLPLREAKNMKDIRRLQEPKCPTIKTHDHCKDSRFDSCGSCVGGGCSWCGDICQSRHSACSSAEHAVSEGQCENNSKTGTSLYCSFFHSCHACMQDGRCLWIEKSSKFKCEDAGLHSSSGNRTCGSTCSEQMTCENCTSMSCMWCLNRKQCIDSNSYVTSFPYGICHEWTIEPHKCQAKNCEYFRTCRSCLQNPSCGFCNDEGDTGGGRCMEGRLDGPHSPQQCSSLLWNFADCPLCQCNGRSNCHPGTDICIKCQNFTEGQNCERCQRGFWKDPKNDSACVKCECGEKADSCDPETGACLCRLRGAIGRKCEECDMFHRSIDGSCFYELSLNYMLTFNLSKSDNQHHTEMNMFVSASPEKDVELNLNCSSPANLTIQLRKNSVDATIVENQVFESYSRRFSIVDLKTQDDKNSTILLFIRHFAYPFVIQVSFSQADQLDLFKFFITFFSCFFSLLLIAFLTWKFKQKYDVYRRNQRHLREMAEMASRPCGKCFLVMDALESELLPMLNLSSYNKNAIKMAVRQKQTKAVPIAIEPLSNQKAAVLSVIVRLPHADEPCALPDQSGLAIASTLITFGNHCRRSSTDPSLKLSKLKSEYNSSAPRLV